MGKKGKKKSGLGAEKTRVKAAKKNAKKMQKESGEDDIDSILESLRVADRAATTVKIDVCPPPTPRSAATFTAHPSKDELILFAGHRHLHLLHRCTITFTSLHLASSTLAVTAAALVALAW